MCEASVTHKPLSTTIHDTWRPGQPSSPPPAARYPNAISLLPAAARCGSRHGQRCPAEAPARPMTHQPRGLRSLSGTCSGHGRLPHPPYPPPAHYPAQCPPTQWVLRLPLVPTVFSIQVCGHARWHATHAPHVSWRCPAHRARTPSRTHPPPVSCVWSRWRCCAPTHDGTTATDYQVPTRISVPPMSLLKVSTWVAVGMERLSSPSPPQHR